MRELPIIEKHIVKSLQSNIMKAKPKFKLLFFNSKPSQTMLKRNKIINLLSSRFPDISVGKRTIMHANWLRKFEIKH